MKVRKQLKQVFSVGSLHTNGSDFFFCKGPYQDVLDFLTGNEWIIDSKAPNISMLGVETSILLINQQDRIRIIDASTTLFGPSWTIIATS